MKGAKSAGNDDIYFGSVVTKQLKSQPHESGRAEYRDEFNFRCLAVILSGRAVWYVSLETGGEIRTEWVLPYGDISHFLVHPDAAHGGGIVEVALYNGGRTVSVPCDGPSTTWYVSSNIHACKEML